MARGQRQVNPWTHATDALVSASDDHAVRQFFSGAGVSLRGGKETPAAPHPSSPQFRSARPCGAASKVLVSFAP
ncbi:hypothetical protein CBM2589_B220106 [Cupriavidus taiwanensis]|uniref:Uncharacterized protein n=1 Tax=Cupriavidus taiwanensis TaxID=164546 RepID=A0A375BNU2_9BURK|nr:hypothetical protein CBM2589_B220106 [Cupriavidus taiwanensis]